VLLQGQDFRAGRRRVRRAGGAHQFRPARARIALTIRAVARGHPRELSAMLIDPSEKKNAAVYLAAYENKLASEVAAGENRGKRLEHDFVVREWIGRSASART